MRTLTPAERFRLESAKQTLRGYGGFWFWMACIVAVFSYATPHVLRNEAAWEAAPVQVAVGRVVRIYPPTPNEAPNMAEAVTTTLKLEWDTPQEHLEGNANCASVAAVSQRFHVRYKQLSGRDVRVVGLEPLSHIP